MWTQVSQSLHESMARVISRIATLLPGILALIVAVLFFAAIAWLLAWLLRALLIAIHIDERLVRGTNTIAEWSPTYTPTTLITRIVFWCIVLVGFLVGLEAFGASSDNLLTARLLGYIPNVVGAVVLLILGNVIARFLSRSVLIGAVNMNLHYADQMAGIGAHRRDGARSPVDRGCDCGSGIRHSLRGHRSGVGARRGSGLA
jgi:hypothetical protein